MKLPTSQAQLGELIYSCIDLTDYPEGSTLFSVIKSEKRTTHPDIFIVEDWLRGLPSACTIPFTDYEINQILETCGIAHWSVDDYWRWCAFRVLAFALNPNAYKEQY